jgi:hypothetical protein
MTLTDGRVVSVLGETYTDKEYVWVRPVNKNPVDILNERHYWVCKIVEVRAMDESNVYALVGLIL